MFLPHAPKFIQKYSKNLNDIKYANAIKNEMILHIIIIIIIIIMKTAYG